MAVRITQKLFPKRVDNTHNCGKLPVITFILLTLLSLSRSLIHIFSADGGAASIAGMDLNVSGAESIIFAFGLWGSSQLLLAMIQLIVVFRYRSLIPLMYLLIMIEVLLRILIGIIKPVAFTQTPPGAIGNWFLLPLAAVMLGLCFIRPKLEKP